jgi:hypothetical protein
MSKIQHVGDLEVNQDLNFQRRFWTIERIGWIVIALAVIAALLGLFGTGPLSSTNAGDKGASLWLEYDRFGRFGSPTTLRVHKGAGVRSEGVVRIWLDQRYLEGVQIEQVTPEPQSVEATLDRLIYTFQVVKPNQPTVVTFHLMLEQVGSLSGRVGLVDETSLSFSQFIYP